MAEKQNMNNNDNMEDIENNEDMEYYDEMEDMENEDNMTSNNKSPKNNKNKKIITGVIVALVAIGLIGGLIWYMNNSKQDDERAKLVSQIHKNNLTKDNADYLQKKKYVNQDQMNQLNSIDQKAGDSNETLDQIKNLLKDQLGILNPINKKLGDNDSSFTKSLNYFLGLIPGLGSAINNVINVNDIKNIVSQKFDLQKIVNENTPIIKKKDEALAMISKVAYDKKALLKGNFTSIAGTYVNSDGKQIVVNKNGTNNTNNNSCTSSKPKLDGKLGFYSWSINCSGKKMVGYFFPIGVPVTLIDGTKSTVVQTDLTKNRVSFGQKLSTNVKDYYNRK